MKSLSLVVAAATLLAMPSLAIANKAASAGAEVSSSAVSPKRDQTIVDVDGKILGRVFDVRADRVTFIDGAALLQVPLASLSADGKRLKTSLSRKQISR